MKTQKNAPPFWVAGCLRGAGCCWRMWHGKGTSHYSDGFVFLCLEVRLQVPPSPGTCWVLIHHYCVDRQEGPGSLNLQEGAVASLLGRDSSTTARADMQKVTLCDNQVSQQLSRVQGQQSQHCSALRCWRSEGGSDAAVTHWQSWKPSAFCPGSNTLKYFSGGLEKFTSVPFSPSLSSRSLGLW